MQIKLSFLGAARNVTGSRFLVELDGLKILVDCGLYQERDFKSRNWDRFPVSPDKIDAVLLTHAHLDHCGLLPKLVKEGFRGRIYCTAATAEIAQIILLDSAHIHEEDAAYKLKRHRRQGRASPRPIVPLYTTADAEKCQPLFSPVGYAKAVKIGKGVEATFHDAGHVLGSSVIKLAIERNGQRRTILFSGDVGREDRPILRDPAVVDHADYVLVESTYGDRIHPGGDDVAGELADVINSTMKAGGNVVIPSFALERSQELLYHLNELRLAGKIGELKVFLDSPMAIRITEVFANHPELFDGETAKRISQHRSPFEFPGLQMSQSTEQSKAINRLKEPAVIIAGSGMCTGGRIKHHLVNNITRLESTILFVGYQAVGTLGRHILRRPDEIRILGRMHPILAKVKQIHGFSAHADKDELYHWLSGLAAAPKKVFVVHGEANSAEAFRDFLHEKTGWDASVPAYGDQVVLD